MGIVYDGDLVLQKINAFLFRQELLTSFISHRICIEASGRKTTTEEYQAQPATGIYQMSKVWL